MKNDTHLYPYSLEYAREQDEVDRWRESYKANVACSRDMEQSIRDHYHNDRLDPECVKQVTDAWGFRRTGFVLSNTIQYKDWDGRFSAANREWAQETYIPPDQQHNCNFVCDAHSGLTDMFTKSFREAYQKLGLFSAEQCEPDSGLQDFTDKVLVLSPNSLKESCWQPENQLWLGGSGFGCSPSSSGRAVYATCLGDGEKARWNRQDFAGVIKPECLPEWAAAKLAQLQDNQSKQQAQQQEASVGSQPEMTMG